MTNNELLERLQSALSGSSLDDEIRSVAVLASVGLALLTLFTNRHADTLERLRRDLGAFSPRQVKRQLTRDILLALLTLAAILAMAPLVEPSASALSFFDRSSALPAMYLVVFVGYCVVFAFQLLIAWRRSGILVQKLDRKGRLSALFSRAS